MKTVRIFLCIGALLAITCLYEAQGQWGVNGSNIFNTNAGNVGIGNNSPTTLLHVKKNMIEPTIAIQNLGGTGGATYTMMDNASGANWKFKATNTGGFKIRDHAYLLDVIVIEPNSSMNAIYIDGAGDVAMGQNTPDGYGLNVINYTSGKAAIQGLDQSYDTYATGMLGVLEPSVLGVPVDVYNAGVLGIKPNAGANGAAVYGWNNDDNNLNYGGIFAADGVGTGTNYGTYSSAMHAANNFAGKFFGRVEVDGHPSTTEAPDYTSTVLLATVHHTESIDTKAVEGFSNPNAGYGIGVQGIGGWMGLAGYADGGAYTGTNYGVYGYAYGSAGTRIGIYGYASGGTTNWAGYFDGDVYISSAVRIGTATQATGYSLSIDGKIACEDVLIEDMDNWPDYVFSNEYNLMTLTALEKSIRENNHLPGIPSAAEIEESGLLLGDMQKKLLEKIEELTLYTIQQGKLMTELQEKVSSLEKENALLFRLGSAYLQETRPVLPDECQPDTMLLEPKFSREEQAHRLTAGEDNPAKIDEAAMVDPKINPENLPGEEDYSPYNAKPADGQEQPAGEKTGTITNYRNMQAGENEQPKGDQPAIISNYREMQGPNEQPAADIPNK